MASLRGSFVWHDLMTTDTEHAARFYPQITGWQLMPWEQDPSYQMWANKGSPIGGLMTLPEEARSMGAQPHWLPYVGTPNADATVSRATDLGGRVLKNVTSIPNVGRFAVLADPQGAVFAVFTPSGEQPGTDAPPGFGEFSWHELATTDWEAAFRFYQTLFGWDKTESMDMGPGGMYQMYGWPGTTLGGMYNKPAEMPAPPHWLCYVTIASADRAAAQIRDLGGTVANGPMEVPGGDRIAQCLDPQGAAFAVHAKASSQAVTPEPPAPSDATDRDAIKDDLRKRVTKKATKQAVRKAVKKTKPVRKKVSKAARKATRKAASGGKTAKKAVRSATKKAKSAGKSVRRKATKTAKRTVRKAAKKTRAAGKSVRRKASRTAKKTGAAAKKVARKTARKASKQLKRAKKAVGRTARKATKRAKGALRRSAKKAGSRARALSKSAKRTVKRRLGT